MRHNIIAPLGAKIHTIHIIDSATKHYTPNPQPDSSVAISAVELVIVFAFFSTDILRMMQKTKRTMILRKTIVLTSI